MLDFGVLTVPILGAAGIFIVALLTGEDIALDRINVTEEMIKRGYDEVVITRQLSDYMREINASASSELSSVNLDKGNIEQSIMAFERFFEIQLLVTGTRNLLGMIPVFINGEIIEEGKDIVVTVRIYNRDEKIPMHRVLVRGAPGDMDKLLQETALKTMEAINPYVVALYHRRTEMKAGNWDFPETHRIATHYLAEQPIKTHYLIYGMLGRMHMLKAERDPKLNEEQKKEQYERAVEMLNGALIQRPDFHFPHLNLAVIHTTHGDYAKAEAEFRRAAEISPRYRTTRELWGKMLYDLGRPKEALEQYVAAVECDPNDPGLRNQLGKLYLELGQRDLARQQFERAIRMNPRETEYLKNWRSLAAAQ